MEAANGRASREASSSSEDFYDTQPTAQEESASLESTAEDHAPETTPHMPPAEQEEDVDDDSSSEMDLSEPSRPATPTMPEQMPESALPAPPPAEANGHAGTKRKLSDSLDTNDAVTVQAEERAKKRKLYMTPAQEHGSVPRTANLPVEIWQRVFLHLPPAMLSRCLRVCHTFKKYLTAIPPQPPAKKNQGRAQAMDSESIWTQSRKTFFPALPRPLLGFTERKMLQLVGGNTCQFCARPPVPAPATSVYNAGPGAHGMRVVFPFRVRSCGQCLEARILKDVQILAHPTFSALRTGVTHGFRSPDLHFVTETVRQSPGGIPANLRFSKVSYIPHLEAIKAEEEEARELGDGAVDEWRKGLVNTGKEAMADCARWEKWELQLRPGSYLAQVLREYDLSSFPRLVEESQSRSAGANGVQPPPTANGTHPLPQPVHVFPNGYGTPYQQPPPQHYPPPPFPPPQPPPHYFQQPLPQPLPQQPPQQQFPRPVRNLQEVEVARQARRTEIERRCRELEPPVEPNVLQHMESFQATMQITTPLTDAAWDMLKPRILAQREAAELVEHDRAAQLAALQAAVPSVVPDEIIPKPAKETYDREYEQAQEPLRKRLGEYADDEINGKWGGGKMLEKDSAPIFAIHVLLHVRRRYVEDKELGLLPRFEPPKRKEGAKQGTPPLEPFLSLDNMKWVYDNKVRPLTDVHRREHFICAGCVEEKKPKWFAFEGLIQHYGAKHTTAFSKGNIVVHWQTAEWPEDPPFHNNPAYWIKQDRRVSEYRAHGRARHTPQAHHDGPFPAPPHLPENPYHAGANGYPPATQGHAAAQFTSPSSHGSPNGYFYQQQTPTQPTIDMSPDAQITKLSSDARDIWDAIDGVKDLLESIRIQTVIHHTVTRFVERFRQKPQLDLLTDALATNPAMRPLKNAHGLACKSCVAAQPNCIGKHGSYWIRIKGVKLFNTSSLITHFKLIHQPQDQPGHLDWSKDMIELPENQIVHDLIRTPGMDDDKLALIAAAFPNVFRTPLPKIGLVTEAPAETATGHSTAKSLLDRLGKKSKAPKKKGAQALNGGTPDRNGSQEPLPEAGEDEYDPRRPMFVQPKGNEPDPSQFDTDARKPSVPAVSQPPAAFNFNAETLAALQSISGMGAQPTQQPPGRNSRSPSVGRAVPAQASHAAAKSTSTPSGPPDIAAILASLTGQAPPAQTVTPPATNSNRSGSASRQTHPDAHHKSQYGAPSPYDRRSSGRQEHAYQAPPQDSLAALQAALSQNTRHFDQNQQPQHHHQPAYAEPPYAPQHQQHQPPPRYQYVYEGEQHYAQPHTPTYRDAPVQYVQLPPERDHGYHQYERAAAPPKPIYVDQYGRPLELIPIDSAPAPVQYAPNPYEQQQYGRRPDQHQQHVYTTLAPPSGAHMQTVYDDRRQQVYYEPVPPHAANGVRYAYDDGGRASVPRS